jgi:hypothetical protein
VVHLETTAVDRTCVQLAIDSLDQHAVESGDEALPDVTN